MDVEAPGLKGDYLNAWLGALGVTVLGDGVRLRWAGGRFPHAVFEPPPGVDLVDAVVAALPTAKALDDLAIANPGGHGRFPRNVTIDQYEAASAIARRRRDFSLAVSVTDLLGKLKDGKMPHSRFDPAAPRGETLWSRLRACRMALADPVNDAVRATFEGTATRVGVNGLGFDVRRIAAGSQMAGGPQVDPLLECLAFYGLSFFPMRGDGDRTWSRGWVDPPRRGFFWPTWDAALDRWGIDALLNALLARDVDDWRGIGFGVTNIYEAVTYRRTGDMDQTTGFASRRLS